MAGSSNSTSSANLFLFSTCFCILLLLDFPGKTVSQSIVRYLPGFGQLPFELETGYVNVDDSDGVELFYYFFKSENDPIKDPLLFWFAGGPGCSGLTTIMIQIGPLSFRKVEYNGSLPTLVLNPNSWTKMSNIVFLDAPVGTGFSYSRSLQGWPSSDKKSAKHSHTFIRKWLVGHPEFLSNPLYLAGDSYSGIVVPLIVQEISDGIEAGDKPLINLQGYLLGNPVTDQNLEKNSVIPFSYGMGLISLELFEFAKKHCGGDYINVDPSNAQCKKDLESVTECTEGLEPEYILDPKCIFRKDENQKDIRLLRENTSNIICSPPSDPGLGCRKYDHLLLYYWTNDDRVQTALNVQKGIVPEWIRCKRNKLDYLPDVETSTGYHLNLSKKRYRSLIFSGDHDSVVPFMSTQAWIESLKLPISDEWRPWFVDSQVAGYTRTYSSNMTYATIKGAGHIASVYKPKECLNMDCFA
ncbi:Serine carboxypeptidase-like, partial [Thalictrum thalictroides]